jgi:acyl-CoA thioesterase
VTAPTASEFDRDTALEPVGEGLWRGRVDPSWFVTTGPNGGFIAALATRALEAATGRDARSLTLHYLVAPAEGQIDVAIAVERTGRTSTFASLRMTQEGRTVALGLGVAAEWREGEPEWADARMPDVARPADAPPLPTDHPRTPVFLRKYEVRWAVGEFGRAEDPARLGAWLRAADGRELDAPLLAAMTDALMPPAFLRTGFGALVPTIDLTIHFRAPRQAGARWALGVFESRVAAGGAVEEDGQLFGEDGILLAQSRQLAVLRGPRG